VTTPRERAAYWCYRGVAWLGTTLPEGVGRELFTKLATIAFHLMPKLRAVVAGNQARILGLAPDHPLVLDATREAFRLYGRYWYDGFHVVTVDDAWITDRFRCEGTEHLDRALVEGRGVILALPHMGNWDAAGRWMKAIGHNVVSVAEDLQPQALFDLFLRHRERLGMRIIGLSSDGRVGRKLGDALTKNGVVALVADRDLGGRGIDVEMFGGRRRLPAGPALLALTTGAPLIVAPIYTEDRGWRCIMHPPLEVPATGDRKADVVTLTRTLAAEFEKAISARPADWHLFQPGWES
jgi:phosphatidylinositol dimannoside acyltransferase